MALSSFPKRSSPFFQNHLAKVLIPLQGKDGTWWDFPMYNYHRQYGTAFAPHVARSLPGGD